MSQANHYRAISRLTWLGKLFLGVGILLYLASLTSRSSLLLAPLGILFASLWINRRQSRAALESVEIEPPSRILAAESEPFREPTLIFNRSNHSVGFLTLELGGKAWMELAGLGPHERLAWKAQRGFPDRGKYLWKDVQLSSTYPFGLVESRRPLGLNGEMLVHPRLTKCDPPAASGLDPMVGGKFRGSGGSVSGAHFSGVRPYQSGDSIQRIHWKTSAKGLGWMTKQFEEELSGKSAVLVDLAMDSNEEQKLHCLRMAGSLAFAALDEGHHVEFLILGEKDSIQVAPFEDGTQILEALACAQATVEADFKILEIAKGLVSRKSAINLVSTEFKSAHAEMLSKWSGEENRVCRLYLPDKWREWMRDKKAECLQWTYFFDENQNTATH